MDEESSRGIFSYFPMQEDKKSKDNVKRKIKQTPDFIMRNLEQMSSKMKSLQANREELFDLNRKFQTMHLSPLDIVRLN